MTTSLSSCWLLTQKGIANSVRNLQDQLQALNRPAKSVILAIALVDQCELSKSRAAMTRELCLWPLLILGCLRQT